MKITGKNDASDVPRPARRPTGKPYKSIPNTRSISLLGAGMVIGAVIGCGITLLIAPKSGREMRELLGSRAGRVGRNTGVWYKLGKELRRAAAAKRKQLEREESRERVRQHTAAQPAEPV